MGGRLLSSIVRPYPAKVAGTPLSFEYESDTGEFTFSFKNIIPFNESRIGAGHDVQRNSTPAQIRSRETEIFVPMALAHDRVMTVGGLDLGDKHSYDESRQTLFIVHHDQTIDAVHTVRVSFNPPLSKHHLFRVSLFHVTLVMTILSLCIGYIIRY